MKMCSAELNNCSQRMSVAHLTTWVMLGYRRLFSHHQSHDIIEVLLSGWSCGWVQINENNASSVAAVDYSAINLGCRWCGGSVGLSGLSDGITAQQHRFSSATNRRIHPLNANSSNWLQFTCMQGNSYRVRCTSNTSHSPISECDE